MSETTWKYVLRGLGVVAGTVMVVVGHVDPADAFLGVAGLAIGITVPLPGR